MDVTSFNEQRRREYQHHTAHRALVIAAAGVVQRRTVERTPRTSVMIADEWIWLLISENRWKLIKN